MSKTSMYIIVAVVVIIIVVGGILAFMFYSPGGSEGTTRDIYVGDTPAYGFANSAASISSNPGPTMAFTAGQTYTVILHNVGTMPHNWAIVNTKADGATDVLFDAKIASASNPVQQGATGQVTFTAGSAGSYYYICQVDSHVSLGMWGTVTINP